VVTANKLQAWGHHVMLGGDWSNLASPVAIVVKDGVLSGGADPRRGRFIFGQ